MFIFVFSDDKQVDNYAYMRKYYDILSKHNSLEHKIKQKISIFNENYTCDDLGFLLFQIGFIENFRKNFSAEWKDNIYFEKLYERLKIVYNEAYTVEQEKEKELFGTIRTRSDESREIKQIIQKDDIL